MSFYRKYRPQKLSEIVDQNHITQTFHNALRKHALNHAYLFAGPRGTGKTSAARIIARAINCLNPAEDGEPCNECEICKDALAGRLVDLIEIDAASNRGIDEMRDLKEKINFTPSRAKFKIYVIDEVHMLTKEAFNALLKTLEEPPAHAYFILATTEAHKVPETILSRCQRFDFHRISTEAIAKHLEDIATREEIKFEAAALQLIAKQSLGGMRDALGMLEQLSSSGEVTSAIVAENLGLTRPAAVEDFVFALLFHKMPEALETIINLVGEGVNLLQFNKAILSRLREIMLEKVSQNKIGEAKNVLTIIEEFTRAGDGLKNAVIPQLPLEMAVIAVCASDVEIPKASTPSVTPKAMVASIAPAEKISPAASPAPAPTPVEKVDTPAIPKASQPTEDAKQALLTVLGKIKKPALKMALRESSILTANGEVVIGVGSDFLLAKIDNAESLGELAILFSEALGKPVGIKVKRVEIEIASTTPEVSKPQASIPKKSSLAQEAENLFDGDDY
ncbi:MAG: DNA polymerase III subunit gamma/tau [Candidatus Gracilibacteria bacterium]|nr:DNA polymerase III subunit gamma/tau [Candidatus Gracilibacteria bacterium]MDD5178980.1 DNA polymerase III subunit gamma/tau [Candidatus Gracilibacteria bacterium]